MKKGKILELVYVLIFLKILDFNIYDQIEFDILY